jgi:predicted transcriptional regulator
VKPGDEPGFVVKKPALQAKASKDWGEMLTDNLRSELEASISEADQGKVVSHEEAIRQIKSRYNL